MIEANNIICDICGHYETADTNLTNSSTEILKRWTLLCTRCKDSIVSRTLKDLTRGP